MTFKVGDKLPSVDLFENTPTDKVNLAEVAQSKKIIIFGVPGAFTPGCSKVKEKINFLIHAHFLSTSLSQHSCILMK